MGRPLITVSAWAGASLALVVSEQEADTPALLARVHEWGYEGPFVLLARHPSLRIRQRAFAQGAYDVIALPSDWHHIALRVRAVLTVLAVRVAPPTP